MWALNIYGGIFNKGKIDRSYKGRVLKRAKFSSDHRIAVVTYVRTWYTHPRARVLPRRSVCVPREGEEGVLPLPFESIIAELTGRQRANGRYIRGLAFMWRPTVELIFTRFEADPFLPSSSSVPYPRSEHASTSRNSRFQPPTSLFSHPGSR